MELGFTCSECHRVIPEGEPMWSVDVNHEVFEDGAITVLEGSSLLT